MSKIALITGGSKGLGAHLVRRFWQDGFSVIVVARNLDNLQSVVVGLPKRIGQAARSLECDLSDVANVEHLLVSIRESIPHLDVLINNAAVQGPIGPLCENDLLAWQQTLQVNLLAPVAICKGLIPLMKRPSGASIINLSGGGATGPRANFSAYATAKTGLVRFSETLAEELMGENIRVNCIAPGAMKTSMLREVLDNSNVAGEWEASVAKEVFAQGGASMDRVADLALFLAKDSCRGISGKLISAVWDNWEVWAQHRDELIQSDAYTLRRIAGRDRQFEWGDK